MAGCFQPQALFITQNATADVIAQAVHIADDMVPCLDQDCDHPTTVNIGVDGNSWWLSRACSPGPSRRKVLGNDKDHALLIVAKKVGALDVVCLFHGVKAESEKLSENLRTELLKGPLMLAWKAVRLGLSEEVFILRVARYKVVVRSWVLRWYLICEEDIEKLIVYQDKQWFSGPWRNPWTKAMEIATVIADNDPQNSQSTVNNGTEALVKKVENQALLGFVHKHIFPIVDGITERFVLEETTKLEKIAAKVQRPTQFYPSQVELKRIGRGLSILADGGVHTPTLSGDHGHLTVEYVRGVNPNAVPLPPPPPYSHTHTHTHTTRTHPYVQHRLHQLQC
jgi:hypothetical protein